MLASTTWIHEKWRRTKNHMRAAMGSLSGSRAACISDPGDPPIVAALRRARRLSSRSTVPGSGPICPALVSTYKGRILDPRANELCRRLRLEVLIAQQYGADIVDTAYFLRGTFPSRAAAFEGG